MKKLLFYCIALLFAANFCWLGCKKGDFENAILTEHTAEYAFPLFNTELKVSDLIGNILEENTVGDTIIINPDNTVTLSYSGDITESKAVDIFNFLDTLIPIAVDSSFFTLPVKTPDGVQLSRVDLSGGTLTMAIKNTMTEPINITLTIPQLSLNGQAYSYTFTIQPGLSVFTPLIELDGWKLNSSNNLITFIYDAYLPDGTRIPKLPASSGLPAVVGFMNKATFYYLEGYWGKVTYGLSTDVIDIDINNTNLDGNVKVKNPRITITVFNSFGFPTRGLIKYLRFVSKNGDLIELQSPLIQQGSDVGIDFAYPSLALNEVGQSKATTFYFDDTNSNIEELFNSQPVQMIYQVDGLANADNNTALLGFVTDSSSVRMNVKVELLLEGQLKDFGADQTLNLDFGSFSDSTAFEEAEFKLVTENTMALSTNLQIYFKDANSNILDSLFVGAAQDIIKAGPVDPLTGFTTGTTRTETFIPMSAVRFENLRKNAKIAFLKTTFTSAENGSIPIKILANQSAVVKMGVRVKKKIG
jgi:hypothetical protein